MLISFSFENWMSFRDKTTISFVASRQDKFRGRVPRIEKYKLNILPILAIYGANASGKSNICKALDFAKNVIVSGNKIGEPINTQPFLLCAENKNKPSAFTFELLLKDTIYDYSFSATPEKIITEKLVKVEARSETDLFVRNEQNLEIKDTDYDGQLEFIKKGTRSNQLFLTNCIEQNNEKYKPIYDWFRDSFILITPTYRPDSLDMYFDKDNPLYEKMNRTLSQLDTGILKLGEQDIIESIERNIDQYPSFAAYETKRISAGDRYISRKSKENDVIKKLVAYHKCEDGTEALLDFKNESDGTKRLIDILPYFVITEILNSIDQKGIVSIKIAYTFAIDEIDRSMHHLLVQHLVEKYLLSCNPDTRSQIIFTTHDLLLMDQSLLRRDEMCVVEKDAQGASSLIPLNEYKGIRVDKDILKSYLQGRFGGIPRL